MQVGQWEGQPGPVLDSGAVAALGADDFLNRVYSSAALPPVALYIGYYGSQREGDTIHSPLNCLPGAGWEPITRTRMSIRVVDVQASGSPERTIVVNRLIVRKDLDQELVLYWYQSHGRVVASEYWGRVLLAFDALRLNRTDGALVRVIAPITPDEAGANATSELAATDLVRAIFPLLASYLPR